MKKHLIVTTAFLSLVAAPVVAQQPTAPSTAPSTSPTAPAPSPSPPPSASPTAPAPTAPAPSAPSGSSSTAPSSSSSSAAPSAGGMTFISEQKPNQWLASNLIGEAVVGPDNKSIGEINDVVFDQSGTAEAAIIGVGGFLGVGEKDVAVPFKSLQVARDADGDLDKVTLSMTRADLEKAPTFMSIADKNSKSKAASGTPATGTSRPAGAPPATK